MRASINQWLGGAMVVLASGVAMGQAVEDTDLGLAKGSVYSTPDPIVAEPAAGEPGENALLGAYFDEAPPLVPHTVEEFLPIRRGENQCLDCHYAPESIGKPVAAGDPTPIPASHLEGVEGASVPAGAKLEGRRYNCTLCHVPQSNAAPLVDNTYRQ